jgi:hypothetical protein
MSEFKESTMFQKLAPLIVLALFAIGVYLMKQGMDNAVEKTVPQTQQVESK